MIPELGNFSAIIAACFAVVLAVSPILMIHAKANAKLSFCRSCALACSLFIIISFFCLVISFLNNDFTVSYVIKNSHSLLPWYYRIGAVWGGHEGSLLLWITILASWLALITLWPKQLAPNSQAKLLAVMGILLLGFLLFLLLTSNPFARTLTLQPMAGQDLNPLLQDPGLMVHPPMLYLGYVGFAVTFAYGIVALWEGQLSTEWLQCCRQWTMIAWALLGLGIVLGSWWSYRELGWGGWWFWDPVENASLLPWLTATCLIHCLVVSEKRDSFKGWTVLLALLCFALSLLGTFLVRSGVLISVHAFSNDPSRGIYLLAYLFLIVGGSLLLYAIRGSSLYRPASFSLLSRESILLLNNVFLLTISFTILLGTLYPIVLDSLGLAKISVGPPYFNKVFIPLMLPLILLMGLAPTTHWHSMSARQLLARHAKRFILCLALALLLPWLWQATYYSLVVIGLFLSLWVFSSVSWQKTSWHHCRVVGMKLAHWGLALCLLGIILSSFYNQQTTVDMQVGDTASLASYQFTFTQLNHKQADNYTATVANFLVTKQHSAQSFRMSSELRVYNTNQQALTKTGIEANAWRDLYLVVGPPLTQGYWTVRIYFKPFIRWIWLGGILIIIGGLLSLIPTGINKRKRSV